MSAWIMLVVGCTFIVGGVSVLNGWRAATYSDKRLSGWGNIAVGAGFTLDGLPKIVGSSDAVGLLFAIAGLALIVVGVVLGARDLRRRRGNA
ncbi:hypothetical protein [Streptacidiphilus rugosus]|uniref:hypothetical protein n=1 Tax=Streptacidiphilus rugosus TaxID=405783 RepID=UPI000564B1F4|nr:hypothetical protein [Streptacidiphilus rugosus]